MIQEIALFLAAAVVAVPLAKKLKLGAVLGYLLAGVAIGPWGFGWIGRVEDVLHASEFGVVLLMFVIGLELQPSRLWRLRREVFGMGGAQVALTTLLLAIAAIALKQKPAAAIVAGFGLAMSSTAFVLQLLAEKNELAARHGRAAFAILLFQDISVIPFLAILPMLAGDNTLESSEAWQGTLKLIAIFVGVIGLGRYALRPVFRMLALTNTPEVFTAASLLTVIGFALAMEAGGMSMSFGAFLAGVLLADSEYRHELQADIEPFKGLTLGLFFIAVGMSANVGLVLSKPIVVFELVVALIVIKAIVLYVIGRLFDLPTESSRALGIAASQGGEFAFVLFSAAVASHVMAQELADLLVVAVTLSMMATPPLYALQARIRGRSLVQERPYDTLDGAENPVIIAGFGPFGQIVARSLRVRKIGFTVLEKNPEQVDFVRRFGNKIFYGDAGRMDLLRAARADKAKAFVLTIPKTEASIQIAETVRKHFPHLTIWAVAVDRNHAMHLMDLGIEHVIRRSYFSSLEMTRQLLMDFGDSELRAAETIRKFRAHDEATLLKQQAVFRDEQKLIQTSQESVRELEQLFESDREVPETAAPPASAAESA